jgi:hypothetical protein
VRVLTREELTAALAARQLLLERKRIAPAEAIRRLTPLQGQHPPAPHIALAARLEGFTRRDLEAAIDARDVVKTTINRMTLHLVAAEDFPAFAQLTRQVRMRTWRKTYPQLDEERVTAELSEWFRTPRTNPHIRERVRRYDGVTPDPWTAVIFARTLVPLVQLPPAGHWNDGRRAEFVLDPRPLPAPEDAGALVLARYLAHWDQPLLAYADRDRIIPFNGRVAASWAMDGPKLTISPHTDFPRAAVTEEALRTARFCAPEAAKHEVAGS